MAEQFELSVENIYKIGGIGWIACGTVKSGRIDLTQDQTLKLKRTGGQIKMVHQSFMHTTDPKTVAEAGDQCGLALKMSPGEVVSGDILSASRPANSQSEFT
jgi:translation elongation factor EF-1alpha